MVYRGKPSAGCEPCRTSKKKCTLEQPSCTRCVRLKRKCSGYGNPSALRIRDETEAVTRKVVENKSRPSYAPTVAVAAAPRAHLQAPAPSKSHSSQSLGNQTSAAAAEGGFQTCPGWAATGVSPLLYGSSDAQSYSLAPPTVPTPGAMNVDLLFDSIIESIFEVTPESIPQSASTDLLSQQSADFDHDIDISPWIPDGIMPKPDDLAVSYFLNCFALQNGHWDYVIKYVAQPDMNLCLTLAIKACGMAALSNVNFMPKGRTWSRNMYVKALQLLNSSLRDTRMSKTDESLIAVNVLSFYENLVCDSEQSFQSWKAHVEGATQLLRLRGKAQFKSAIGRALFRETRAQVITHSLWDTLEPPAFFRDWMPALQANSPNLDFIRPADDILVISIDLATLRSKVERDMISDTDAIAAINDIYNRTVQWSFNTTNTDERWRYHDLQVDDSPHVWNGMVHAYSEALAPSVWNTYRSMRILATRTQQFLSLRLHQSDEERERQQSYFRTVRRQLTNDICATVPCQLGHASPAFTSPYVLVTAYNTIWPLFQAGACVLERIGYRLPMEGGYFCADEADLSSAGSSAAVAQFRWIVRRFEYISKSIGLRWADGIAAILPGHLGTNGVLHPQSRLVK
ncbi:hypothetical protein K431DRAFT_24043 [Polychaeton citri CBS 116435]|uniref:Zn(2)-C6 fungal-type domain-containing protein n=1 Tax=Polychaeton citri CBS 116435 TaxID=1314669 RepID=A0A9P4USD4_9PEZI|nr:hypothetical protein K431DRAFT_24043 [Polychaeton citri CBS 116435]